MTALALDVFRELERSGIPHCVWKGSIHLGDSLEGRSDLDVLVDPARREDLHGVLASLGCRTSRVAPRRADVGVEDLIGIDPESGRVLHFHVYHRLVLGERHLDRYRLPWERWVLQSRTRMSGVCVAEPAVEAVLLLIRASLRLTLVNRSLSATGLTNRTLRGEFEWLIGRSDRAAFLKTLEGRLGKRAIPIGERALDEGPTTVVLARLRRLCRDRLESQASVRGARGMIRRYLRILAWARRGVSRRFLERPAFLGRGPYGGGMLVAVVGADGSGKSTLARHVRTSLSPKLDVMYTYLGSGDGPSSLIRWPMKMVHRRLHGSKRRHEGRPDMRADVSGPIEAARVLWALALANEKWRKLQRAMLARSRGLIVICDRYPQTQFPGQNDGPLLWPWLSSPSPIRRALAVYEARPYRLASRFVPDLVVRLNIDEATALVRRPELDPAYLRRRIELVSVLSFEESLFGVVEIDATRPEHEVHTEAMSAIWARS